MKKLLFETYVGVNLVGLATIATTLFGTAFVHGHLVQREINREKVKAAHEHIKAEEDRTAVNDITRILADSNEDVGTQLDEIFNIIDRVRVL